MSLPKISNELRLAQLRQAHEILGMNPSIELPLHLAAVCLNMSVYTVQAYVSKRPNALPKLTKRESRVFIKVGDIQEFLSRPKETEPSPAIRRRGRPNKAQQMARQARKEGGAQ